MSALPSHAALSNFSVVEGKLQIGGLSVSDLAARVGRTPFYAYDRAAIASRIGFLRGQLPSAIKLHYALKANPMPAVVGFMASRVDGMDVASGQELRLALDAGMAPEHISFAGPGKSVDELRQAVGSGILINVESFREIRLLAELSSDDGGTVH